MRHAVGSDEKLIHGFTKRSTSRLKVPILQLLAGVASRAQDYLTSDGLTESNMFCSSVARARARTVLRLSG